MEAVHSVCRERLRVEKLNYKRLPRWIWGLNSDDPARNHSTISCNRQRLLDETFSQPFFENNVPLARMRELPGTRPSLHC